MPYVCNPALLVVVLPQLCLPSMFTFPFPHVRSHSGTSSVCSVFCLIIWRFFQCCVWHFPSFPLECVLKIMHLVDTFFFFIEVDTLKRLAHIKIRTHLISDDQERLFSLEFINCIVGKSNTLCLEVIAKIKKTD